MRYTSKGAYISAAKLYYLGCEYLGLWVNVDPWGGATVYQGNEEIARAESVEEGRAVVVERVKAILAGDVEGGRP